MRWPQINPLRDAMLRGPWPNRDLLMVPLGSGVALAAQASQMAGVGGVAVHVTPHAAKAKHVWTFIGGAWNRLNAAVQQLPHPAHRDDTRRAAARHPAHGSRHAADGPAAA
jgi:hypothetical protein